LDNVKWDLMSEKTILAIDDDDLVLKLLDVNFNKRGFNVVEFLGGEGAFEKAKELQPAVIILDIMMPLMDGWEVLEKLKGNPATQDIPVVILTVKSSQDDVSRAVGMGADRYVMKPFDPSDLVSLVYEVMGGPE